MESQTKGSAPAIPGAAVYNFAAIDYTRVVMALLVVAIHCPPFTGYSGLVLYGVKNYLSRLGVPFFFFCNGYFLFRPSPDKQSLRKNTFAQLKKLLEMYLMWTLIYMPIIIYSALHNGDGLLKNCLRFVRDFIFKASYGHLWYLPAAMLAIFLVWLALEKGLSWHRVLWISGILYVIGIADNSWYGLFRALPVWNVSFIYCSAKLFLKAISTTRNGLFFGFLFVALGAYFAQHPLPKLKICRIGFVLAMGLGFVEAFIVKYFAIARAYSMYLFLPFAVTFLFCGLLQLPAAGAPDTRFCRKFSSLIYFIHNWFVFLYGPVQHRLGERIPLLESFLFCYGTVVVCSAVFALIVIRISEYKRFAWLKRFY